MADRRTDSEDRFGVRAAIAPLGNTDAHHGQAPVASALPSSKISILYRGIYLIPVHLGTAYLGTASLGLSIGAITPKPPSIWTFLRGETLQSSAYLGYPYEVSASIRLLWLPDYLVTPPKRRSERGIHLNSAHLGSPIEASASSSSHHSWNPEQRHPPPKPNQRPTIHAIQRSRNNQTNK